MSLIKNNYKGEREENGGREREGGREGAGRENTGFKALVLHLVDADLVPSTILSAEPDAQPVVSSNPHPPPK